MRILVTVSLLIAFLFSYIILAQSSIEKLTTSINGTIINSEANLSAMVSSENGKYWCTYKVIAATDEMRELNDLKLYENNNLILTLAKIAGSDVEITNSGKIVFYDHSQHFLGKLKIHFYSKEGAFLFSKEFEGADQFAFSPSGETMGVQTSEGISIISLASGNSNVVDMGLQFAIDEHNEFVAVPQEGKILIYKNSSLIRSIQTGIELPRKVILSVENNLVGVIDKYNLKIYSLDNGNLLFEDKIGGDLSFRDLKIVDNKIIAGIHKRNKEESKGLLRVYDLNGNQLDEKSGESRQLQKFEKLNLEKRSQSSYDPIPWPFFPFDSMRTVWNHYEQHMGLGGADSYLHQGLDLITPIGEHTYSVIDGYVKLVLTIGGDSYWRTAISDTQIAGRSDGWLSAHLIQSTIQFEIGDTVEIHDYLGDIVYWAYDWGHIHFVNISDSGSVWYYNDGEWGINFNPILALQPYPDVTAPYIDPVFAWSKFAFAINESAIYLTPDSLFGQIDIIVKVVDYVGDSEWQQPAYTTWYTIKKVSNGQIIKPRTLGHILNHKYPFYDTGWFMDYAGVIYQRDNTLLPSGWMDMQRNFYHNLTNNNGDSLVELSEKSLAFNTDNYEDGDYRIIVEVYDEAGNFDIDSMDVKFKNGNPVGTENEVGKIYTFNLEQNYPNPFNPTTSIQYAINSRQFVTLKIYDVLGNEVATVVNEEKQPGKYEAEFDASGFTSGIYFYKLQAGSFVETKKMILMK
jgi:hypothetical protein